MGVEADDRLGRTDREGGGAVLDTRRRRGLVLVHVRRQQLHVQAGVGVQPLGLGDVEAGVVGVGAPVEGHLRNVYMAADAQDASRRQHRATVPSTGCRAAIRQTTREQPRAAPIPEAQGGRPVRRYFTRAACDGGWAAAARDWPHKPARFVT
eukprot:365865-Chlamydomonas_euryale.AAC.11